MERRLREFAHFLHQHGQIGKWVVILFAPLLVLSVALVVHVAQGLAAQTIRPNLTEQEARNMSVKERLTTAGLFHEFADAVDRRDAPELDRILRQTHLEPDNIQAVIEAVLGTPDDAQQIVGRERRERVSQLE